MSYGNFCKWCEKKINSRSRKICIKKLKQTLKHVSQRQLDETLCGQFHTSRNASQMGYFCLAVTEVHMRVFLVPVHVHLFVALRPLPNALAFL